MTQDQLEQPTPELPPAIGPGPSPFWPQHLVDLLFRPTSFFKGQLALGRTPYVLFVTWVLGMSSVIDQIDSRILRADLLNEEATWQVLESLVGTWPRLWAMLLGGGLVGGAFYWWIGGWWCRVRLRWSGAPDPDARLARLLLIYSTFVYTGPAVLSVLVQTALYPSYLVAYQSEMAGSVIILVMIAWSFFTTYKGALALFPVSPGRARIWFFVLPALFYAVLILGGGAIALLAEP